ncbi:MAG TPA: M20/M25/M40 family metallo-hydrolase, partial [Bacillota bacterium]
MTDDARLPVDEGWVLERLEDLIKIPSVNPSLVPGGEGEERIARFVGQVLGDLGLKVTYQKLGPKRANVIGVLKGKGGAAGPAGRAGSGRTLLLNGHLDTVGAAGMKIEPFAPARRGNKVYGRGAFDMKGGVAAMLGVARAIVASGVALAGDLILTFVADEEYASIGTEKIAQTYRADAAIVCEPTGLNIGVVHKGFAWVRLDVQDKAAHGSEFGQGVDAITKAGKFLAAMEAYEKRVLAKKVHPKVGRPSVHASLISGGIELSTYPDHCRVEIERRTIPGETRQT